MQNKDREIEAAKDYLRRHALLRQRISSRDLFSKGEEQLRSRRELQGLTETRRNIVRLSKAWERRMRFPTPSQYHTELAKRRGFASLKDYEKYLLRQRGFPSARDYQDYLSKRRGFAGLSEYRKSLWLKKGYETYVKYLNKLVRSHGFQTYQDYLKNWAEKKGFRSHTDYRKDRLRKHGIFSASQYQQHLAAQKGYRSAAEYVGKLAQRRQKKPKYIEFSNLLSNRLWELRKTQSWLAKQIGARCSLITEYVQGRSIPRKERMKEIFVALNIPWAVSKKFR